MMSLTGSKTHKPRSKHTLLENFNLIQDENSDMVIITVGRGQYENALEVGSNKTKILYHDNPLDLGFVFTFWKVQGLTFEKVIL